MPAGGCSTSGYWLLVRARGIGLHPMSQILEEAPFAGQVNGALGLAEPIQFLLRCGYVDEYPDPVSEHRPVAWFVHTGAAGPATAQVSARGGRDEHE